MPDESNASTVIVQGMKLPSDPMALLSTEDKEDLRRALESIFQARRRAEANSASIRLG
jgi:hypothetical protein